MDWRQVGVAQNRALLLTDGATLFKYNQSKNELHKVSLHIGSTGKDHEGYSSRIGPHKYHEAYDAGTYGCVRAIDDYGNDVCLKLCNGVCIIEVIHNGKPMQSTKLRLSALSVHLEEIVKTENAISAEELRQIAHD